MSEEKNGVGSYRRFLEGDNTAAEELIQTYSDAMIRFAYCYVKDSHVAEDIMEDAFAALLIKRRHFSDCENFRAYLYKIVRNKSVDYLREHKRHVPLSDLENVLSAETTEEKLFKRERNVVLYRCLQQLPSQYGEVLYLTYIEDYKISDVCTIVRKSTRQVYNLLARAKTALKEALEKEGVVYENI